MDLIGNLANLKVDTVLSAVDKYVPGAKQNIKNLADKAKAYVNNVSELELKVLEATNHDPWGPHGSVMQEITNNAYHSEGFYQIMGILDQRLQESAENWRLVYKSLLLLEYMTKHGPLSVADGLVSYSRLSHLEKLRDRFEFKEASGRDQGINVRQRAGALVALVQDRDKLNEERDKAAKNKSKYTGMSSSSARYGGFGPGSTGSSSSSNFSTSRDHDSYGSSSMGSGGLGGSSYRHSSSGAGAGDGSAAGVGGAAAGAAGGIDPVEATRQRIARLKADGGMPAPEGDGAVGLGLETPDGLSPKKPKKLSDIKINPAISATFAKGGLAPPPSSSGSKRGGSGGGAGTAATGIDLLGDLDVSAPPPAAAAAPSSSTGKGALDDWDNFSTAPTSTAAAAGAGVSGSAAGDDDWAAFDSAPPATSSSNTTSSKKPVDINSLLGPLPTATTATAPAAAGSKASKGPLPLDDFCTLPAAAPAAAPLAAAAAVAAPAAVQPGSAGFDPFGGSGAAGGWSSSSSSTAPAAGGSSDPFAASGSIHMVPQAPKQRSAAAAAGPKLGPETAKAKDPFADLALI